MYKHIIFIINYRNNIINNYHNIISLFHYSLWVVNKPVEPNL